jgi:hypothetical protein
MGVELLSEGNHHREFEDLFRGACKINKHLQNIEFLFGDSRVVLQAVVSTIDDPAMFWLDAHWCSMDSYGSDHRCPIIDEIKLIRSTGIEHYIFIDDARLFASPPPFPNKIEQWPTIDQICSNIQSGKEPYYIVIFEDAIAAVPERARLIVAEYCQRANTQAWNEYGRRIAPSSLSRIKHKARVIARDAWLKIKPLVRSKA